MPYANNNGVKIYYEVEGQGPPLVLAHGGGIGNLDGWRRYGYTEALNSEYQLILFDARGHGQSDKPHEVSAYGPKMADDVVSVLDNLGINRAHYLGYSTGALTGFLLAAHIPERFYSFIIGCMSPYGFPEEMVKMTNKGIEELKLFLTDPKAALRHREQNIGRSLTIGEKNTLLAIDAEATISMLTAQFDIRMNDQDLASIPVPCLVYCGDIDPLHTGAKESVNHIPKARFISLPGIAHVPAWSRSDLVLPHIKEFLAKVSKHDIARGG